MVLINDAAEKRAYDDGKVLQLRQFVLDLKGVPNTKCGNEHMHPEGDALEHTRQVATLALRHYSKRIGLVWAALLHDIGKAVQLNGHAEIGARMLRGLELSHSILGTDVIWLVENHMKLMNFEEISLSKMDALMDCYLFPDLVRLRKLDLFGRKANMKTRPIEEIMDDILILPSEYYKKYKVFDHL